MKHEFLVKAKIKAHDTVMGYSHLVKSVSYRGAALGMLIYLDKITPGGLNKATTVAFQIHRKRKKQ